MDFGEVLTRAWRIIWKYKILWIFGILAGLGGSGGNPGPGSNGSNGNNNFNYQYNYGQNVPWYQVERWFNENWWIFILLALAFVALIVVIVVLSTFGRIGLARGAWQADEGATKLGFGQLFGESGPYFWRVFGLSLLIMVLWIALLALIFLPALAFTAITFGVALLCIGPLLLLVCCLLIPVGWAVTVITEQAIVAITCENLGLIDGLKRGWQVFRANLGPQAIMFLILGIGGGIVRFIIALPAFLIALPLIGAAIANTRTAWMAGGITSLVLLCIFIPIALVLNGVVTAYTGTAWTLTFRRLTGRAATAPAVEVVPAP